MDLRAHCLLLRQELSDDESEVPWIMSFSSLLGGRRDYSQCWAGIIIPRFLWGLASGPLTEACSVQTKHFSTLVGLIQGFETWIWRSRLFWVLTKPLGGFSPNSGSFSYTFVDWPSAVWQGTPQTSGSVSPVWNPTLWILAPGCCLHLGSVSRPCSLQICQDCSWGDCRACCFSGIANLHYLKFIVCKTIPCNFA